MAISRHEPWDAVARLYSDINRLFDERAGAADESSGATAEWIPAVDIDEYADRFVLFVDLPGVNADAIDVTLEGGVLTIGGVREQKVESEGVTQRRRERGRGRFFRRFTLPDTANADEVRARGRNGVLEIEIPKRVKAQKRRIEVDS